MKIIPGVLLWALTVPVLAADIEADIEAGKNSARVCGSCHGPRGIAKVSSYPSLAGQSAEYLVKQLLAFREGSRKDPQMSTMAKHLSDEDIANLSAWYNSLPACKAKNRQ